MEQKNQKNIIVNSLSKLELAIIQFIHEFGFCEIHHIRQRFGMGRTASYGQMKILMRFGMVKHAMIFRNRPGVYFLTAQAVRLINSDLPPITQIPRNTYLHHLAVLNVYLSIRHAHPDGLWISERKLIRQKYEDMAGTKEHLPDGMLILPDEKRIPIEVELSLKARERLMNILTDYAVDKTVYEVWYFCSSKIISVLREQVAKLPKIKIHLLDEEHI